MDDLALARALHVLAVIVWIGGVAMVTTIVLPAARRNPSPRDGAALFLAVERRFALQAKLAVLLAGATGIYMVERLGAWPRFAMPEFWWMHAMAALWAIFAVVLFVAEPLFLHRWFERRLEASPAATLRVVQRLHGVLLAASLLTVAAAVAGSHGAVLW